VFIDQSTIGSFKNLMFIKLNHDKTPVSHVGVVYVKQDSHGVSSYRVWSYRELRFKLFIRTPNVLVHVIVPISIVSRTQRFRLQE
jgi:hypothetical protein